MFEYLILKAKIIFLGQLGLSPGNIQEVLSSAAQLQVRETNQDMPEDTFIRNQLLIIKHKYEFPFLLPCFTDQVCGPSLLNFLGILS